MNFIYYYNLIKTFEIKQFSFSLNFILIRKQTKAQVSDLFSYERYFFKYTYTA